MSGFEVAGVVLGAIPLALELLKHYEDAANRLNYWRKIQKEYLHCKAELEFQELLFKKNLRRLLMPLDIGDTEIESLLTNPDDPVWKDPSTENLLEARLQDAYQLYLDYVKRLDQTMEELKELLAVDSVKVQDRLARPRDSWTLKGFKTKVLESEWLSYEKYRFRFANSAKDRHRLLDELNEYNTKLDKLLRTSDEDADLVVDREHTAVDDKLCSFWIQATRIYTALSGHWDCECASQADHTVRVSLIHQAQSPPGFKLAWTKTQPELCDTCYLLISKTDRLVFSSENMPIDQVGAQTKTQSRKSAMKGKGPAAGQYLRISAPLVPVIDDLELEEIASICSTLRVTSSGCVGYVMDENSIYYVNHEPRPGSHPIALEDLIRNQLGHPPTRRQRFRISLAVASSFMQLLKTPWMPPEARKPEIVFIPDEQYYSPELVLDYPSLLRGDTLAAASLTASKDSPPKAEVFGPMEFLGVLLLELCFWSLLEAHPLRVDYPKANTEKEKVAFDMAVAGNWRREVLEDSGRDYKKAVDWCFEGYKDVASASWRKDMFRNVIQPLEKCNKYLSRH